MTGLSSVHKAQLALTISTENVPAVLFVTGTEAEAIKLCADINAMSGENTAMYYPTKEILYTSAESRSAEYEHERLHVLSCILENSVRIVTTSVEALTQPTIPPDVLKSHYFTIQQGQEIDLKQFTEQLIHSGYVRCENVEGKGQFAIRGAIADIFPVQMDLPVRLELWGDEIDTIHYFDVETQRRTEQIQEFTVSPASEILYQPEDLIEKIQKFSAKVRGKKSQWYS